MSTKRSAFASILAKDISTYISEKRALGNRYLTEEDTLRLLDRFLAAQGIASRSGITPELVNRFLYSRPRRTARSYNLLRVTIKAFFEYLVERHRIPGNPVQAPERSKRDLCRPFIFTPSQIRELLTAAGRLPSKGSSRIRRHICYAIFALLYALGLRIGEVTRLCISDVDLNEGRLLVRMTKFSKTRWVPFGPNVRGMLQRYLVHRQRLVNTPLPDAPLFSFTGTCSVSPQAMRKTFRRLISAMDLRIPPGSRPPVVHSLRHSFAVSRLLKWYRQGANVSERLYALSTFMGHVDPTSTQVYLTITDDLLFEASRRFEDFASPDAKWLEDPI